MKVKTQRQWEWWAPDDGGAEERGTPAKPLQKICAPPPAAARGLPHNIASRLASLQDVIGSELLAGRRGGGPHGRAARPARRAVDSSLKRVRGRALQLDDGESTVNPAVSAATAGPLAAGGASGGSNRLWGRARRSRRNAR